METPVAIGQGITPSPSPNNFATSPPPDIYLEDFDSDKDNNDSIQEAEDLQPLFYNSEVQHVARATMFQKQRVEQKVRIRPA